MKMRLGGFAALTGGMVVFGAATAAQPQGTEAVVRVTPPLGLPAIAVPRDNPLTKARIDLGRKLFMDRRLSPNDTMSCGMCHVPEQAFTSNELGGAVGLEGRSVRRNSPAIYNVAYFSRLFHDGREFSLENQIWGPLLARNEMGNPSPGSVIEKIRSLRDYDGLFETAFAGRGPEMQTIGEAIAGYERTMVSGNSRFDRWHYGGQRDALNEREQSGFELFSGKAGCAVCHTVGERHALFSDEKFHNTGIGYERSMARTDSYRVEIAPGVYAQISAAAVRSVSEPAQNDVGRYEITLDPKDRWAYKTPSLRNVALTAPYMHDGSFGSLEDIVEFYDRGGVDNPEKSPLIRPLKLDTAEKGALVSFLKTLTGDNIDTLAADARAAAPHDPLTKPYRR